MSCCYVILQKDLHDESEFISYNLNRVKCKPNKHFEFCMLLLGKTIRAISNQDVQ